MKDSPELRSQSGHPRLFQQYAAHAEVQLVSCYDGWRSAGREGMWLVYAGENYHGEVGGFYIQLNDGQ
jgi:hypothetical protein